MIICYQGSPGSGKSYDAVNRIVENLKKGRVVYTNIDGMDDSLNREVIRVLTELDDFELSKRLIHLSSDQVGQFWKIAKSGSMIIIDEIHNWFNSRDWQSKTNKEFASWASTHRHHGYDVLMVTQDINKVDSQVRSVVEFTYEYRKLNMFGSFVKNRYICYAYIGGEVTGRPMGKIVRSYNQKIFSAYKSYIAGDIKELGIQTHFNILRHPIFYSIPIVLILFIYFFSKSSFIHGDFLMMKKKASVAEIDKTRTVLKDNKTLVTSSEEVVMYERNLDSNGKPVGELKRTVLKGNRPLNEVKKASSSLVNSKGKSTGDKTLSKAPVSPAVLPPALSPVHNYQGFVSSGDTLYVLIGNRKTSLSDLKVKYPDAEIIDGRLRLSGVTYYPGQSVPL